MATSWWEWDGTAEISTARTRLLEVTIRSYLDRSDYTNGKRVYPSSYELRVSAKACHWSLEVLCDGHSLLTYTGRGFAVTYDPAKASLSAAPMFKKGASVIVGEGMQMYNDQYALVLEIVNDGASRIGRRSHDDGSRDAQAASTLLDSTAHGVMRS